MRYLLLMYDEPGADDGIGADERRALLDEYARLSETLVAEEAHVDANPLQPARTARTVRVAGGETSVAEGPAIDSEATLGGYYLIDVPSIEDAVAWAARVPAARFGPVEVRPVRTI